MNASTKPNLTSSVCEHCGVKMEYDSAALAFGEVRKVECPSCHGETRLFVLRKPSPSKPAAQNGARPVATPSRSNAMLVAIIGLFIASAALFGVGCMLSMEGLMGTFQESQSFNGSAIRQNVYAVQYGAGFTIIALSLILAVLTGFLAKQRG